MSPHIELMPGNILIQRLDEPVFVVGEYIRLPFLHVAIEIGPAGQQGRELRFVVGRRGIYGVDEDLLLGSVECLDDIAIRWVVPEVILDLERTRRQTRRDNGDYEQRRQENQDILPFHAVIPPP